MDEMDWDEVQFRNININGKAWHLMKLAEECAELSGAILKHVCKGESEADIITEMVDVRIALSNVRLIYRKHGSLFELCEDSKRKRIAQKTEELERNHASLGDAMLERMGKSDASG